MQTSIPVILQFVNGGALPCSSVRYTFISFTGVLLVEIHSIFVYKGSITISGFLPLFLKLICLSMDMCNLEFTMLLSTKSAHKKIALGCMDAQFCSLQITIHPYFSYPILQADL